MPTKQVADKIRERKHANDRIYTPLQVAKDMIDLCEIQPTDKVLDPSKGGGVFFDNLPDCKKDWCEIDEGKDFFDYNKNVDIIIGNPPYSIWSKWLKKTLDLNPKKFCYIFGIMNLTTYRLGKIKEAGYGITHFKIIRIDWWFSESFLVCFEKGKKNIIDFEPKTFQCECGDSRGCGRGRKGFSYNVCGFKTKN